LFRTSGDDVCDYFDSIYGDLNVFKSAGHSLLGRFVIGFSGTQLFNWNTYALVPVAGGGFSHVTGWGPMVFEFLRLRNAELPWTYGIKPGVKAENTGRLLARIACALGTFVVDHIYFMLAASYVSDGMFIKQAGHNALVQMVGALQPKQCASFRLLRSLFRLRYRVDTVCLRMSILQHCGVDYIRSPSGVEVYPLSLFGPLGDEVVIYKLLRTKVQGMGWASGYCQLSGLGRAGLVGSVYYCVLMHLLREKNLKSFKALSLSSPFMFAIARELVAPLYHVLYKALPAEGRLGVPKHAYDNVLEYWINPLNAYIVIKVEQVHHPILSASVTSVVEKLWYTGRGDNNAHGRFRKSLDVAETAYKHYAGYLVY
jgi:hypothetical protein